MNGKVYAVTFELQDFGQNVSHLVGKTYYTHDFFTDRQVFAGISHAFAFLGDTDYTVMRTPCTLAIPLQVRKQKSWFSTVNANLQKEQNTGKLRYITEGYQEYLLPGCTYLAFSLVKPEGKALFIGKKSCLALITDLEEIEYSVRRNCWTTLDQVYFTDYEKYRSNEILKMKIKDASQRYLIGQFETTSSIEVTYDKKTYRFYSLWKYVEEKNGIKILC